MLVSPVRQAEKTLQYRSHSFSLTQSLGSRDVQRDGHTQRGTPNGHMKGNVADAEQQKIKTPSLVSQRMKYGLSDVNVLICPRIR